MNPFFSKFLKGNLTNVLAALILLCGTLWCEAQGLVPNETIQTRHIQELLITAPEKAYEEAKKLSHSPNRFASHCGEYYIANYFYAKSDYPKSKPLLLALLKSMDQDPSLNREGNYRDLMGMCVNKLFYLYKNAGEYNQALVLITAYKDKVPGGRYQQQLGILKVAMGDFANGIALLKKDLHTSMHLRLGVAEQKKMNDKLFADRHNEIGEAYQKYYVQTRQNKYLDSADVYFSRAAKLMLADGFQTGFTQALLDMHKAKSAALKGDYTGALRFYKRRKYYPEILGNLRTVQIFDLGMADCYFHLKQNDSVIFFSKQFLKNYQVTKVSKENLLIA